MRSINRGMTLIEVLVAFVILSVAMGVIMQIFSGGIRNARLAEGYSRALFLAESRMAAVGREQLLVPGEMNGQTSPDLRWRVIVSPFDDAGASEQFAMPVRLYQVKVVVNWSEEGGQRLIELASLKLGPKQ